MHSAVIGLNMACERYLLKKSHDDSYDEHKNSCGYWGVGVLISNFTVELKLRGCLVPC